MRLSANSRSLLSLFGVVLSVFLLTVHSIAQAKPETITAIAYGKGMKASDSKGVTIVIENYSTAEEAQALSNALKENPNGNEGLLKALKSMKPKGRISFTGVEEYNIAYARSFPTPNGRKIRLITDRPSTFRETQGRQSTTDYSLSALELELADGNGKSTGTFFPACEFKFTQENGIEIAAYYHPWRLEHITVK